MNCLRASDVAGFLLVQALIICCNCAPRSRFRRRGRDHRAMTQEGKRSLGLCKGAARRERTCSISSAESKFGRWQRSHNSVALCCGSIFIFFAIMTIITYHFEPSILIGGEGQQLARWHPHEVGVADEEVSATENRRILRGGATMSALELLQDIVTGDQRLESQSKRSREDVQTEVVQDSESPADDFNPLRLATGIKIFVYDLPTEYNRDWLNDSRCSNHLFAAEVAIHRTLLASPLRTMAPDAADFFFVPVYVSCNFSPKNGFPTLTNATTMLRSAVDLISRQMVYWNRSEGRDHIFIATHDFGACFEAKEDLAQVAGVPEFLQKSIILQTFGKDGEQRHPCQLADSIIIPPYLPPESVRKYWMPVENQERNIFAHFRGKLELHPKNVSGHFYSKGIRTKLWRKFKKNRRFFLQRKRLDGFQSEMLRSKFCLAPSGWAPWSPRIVESVLYGCVPVIIADDIALPHSHVISWPRISLSVREKDVDKLDKILRRVEATNLTAIQNNLWKEANRRALLYSDPLRQGDASWHIFNLLAQKKLVRHAQNTLDRRDSLFGDVNVSQLPADSVTFSSV